MEKTLVVCSILAKEVEKVMEELGLGTRVHYIDASLHVDLGKMEQALIQSLDELKIMNEQPALILGTKCHPDIQKIAEDYSSNIICGSNCIEILLGTEKLQELEKECETFFITDGWLKYWKSIFCGGELGWDPVDGRMNFSRYERILLLDANLNEFTDEDILEFFEFTGVPIEIITISLDILKEKMLDLLI